MEDDALSSCPVCLNDYNLQQRTPRLLPCTHSLCQECVSTLITQTHTQLDDEVCKQSFLTARVLDWDLEKSKSSPSLPTIVCSDIGFCGHKIYRRFLTLFMGTACRGVIYRARLADCRKAPWQNGIQSERLLSNPGALNLTFDLDHGLKLTETKIWWQNAICHC